MANKKAQVAIITVIMLLALLGMVIYSQSSGYNSLLKLGGKQNALLESYLVADAARQFMQEAAQTSASQAFYELAKNGGYENAGNSACGEISSHAIWIAKDGRLCFPPDLLDAFKSLFKTKFSLYQTQYSKQLEITTQGKYNLLVNYIFDIEEQEAATFITGISDSLTLESKSQNFIYSIDPYFETTFQQSISGFYALLIAKAQALDLAVCIDDPPKCCDQIIIEGFTCTSDTDAENKAILFDITSQTDFYVATAGNIKKEIAIKFALENYE